MDKVEELEKDVDIYVESTRSRLREINRELRVIRLTSDRFYEKIQTDIDENGLTAEKDGIFEEIGEKIDSVEGIVTGVLDELMNL